MGRNVIYEVVIPGKVVPKARPRFDTRSGRAYTAHNYSAWLSMASQTVAYTLRKPGLTGPLLLRCAISPDQTEVAVMPCSPVTYTSRRFDLDNAVGAVMDALQKGQAVRNDRDFVKIETWLT